MPILARGNPARWWKSRSCGGISRAPRGLFIGPFRRWLTRGALALLLLLLGGLWYITNPNRISRLSEVLLSRVLGGNVTVRSGHLSFAGTLILEDIQVHTPSADTGPSPEDGIPIFSAEQIEARFDWLSLLSGQLSATQLVATSPVFEPVENRDTGQWNYERLRPGFGGSSGGAATNKGLSLPVVVLRDAHVRWGEVYQGKFSQTSETVVDGDLTPDPLLDATYRFQFTQFAPSLTAPNVPSLVPGLPGLSVRGTWDTVADAFNFSTENVVMSDTLRDAMPRVARDWCQEHHLAGRLSKVVMDYNAHDGPSLTVVFDNVGLIWMVEPEPGIVLAEDRPAYPLDVSDVRGQVVFSLKQNLIHVDLHGKAVSQNFNATCDWHGTSSDAPFDLTLEFPNANISDRYPPLFLASNTSQDLIQRMEPHGRMDIRVEAHRAATRGPVEYAGQIDLHDAHMRYAHFPAPIQQVNGRITFDNDSVTFHDVTGKCDQMDARISGTCGTVWTNRFVDMTVSSPNIVLDDGLAACLPDAYQDIWRLFSLSARGSFVCRITRGTGLMDPQKIVVDFDILEAHGYLRNFPYPFTHGAGTLHLEEGGARIDHFTAHTGADDSGRITLDGVVRQSGEDVARLEPEIHLQADVPVDPWLMQAFPETLTERLAGITLGGRAGYDGTIRRVGEPGAETLEVAGNVNWKDGTLQAIANGQPLHFSGIATQATISPTAVDIKSASGGLEIGAQKLLLQLAGKLDLTSASGLLHVTAAGKDLALPAAAPTLLSGSWRDTWQSYQPSGAVDVTGEGNLRINLPANPAAAQPALALSNGVALDAYTVHLTLHDASLKDPTWPEALAAINGKIEIVPRTVSLIGMTARMGNIALAWDGQTEPATGKITLTGDATSKGLPTQWLNHLPGALSDMLDKNRPDVALSLHLDSLSRPAADRPWELQGKLQADNLTTVGSVPMTLEHAEFAGKGAYDPAAGRAVSPWMGFSRSAPSSALEFAGNFTAAGLQISERHIDTLTARVQIDSPRHVIDITDLNGKVAGGAIQGNIHIATSGAVAAGPAIPATLPAGADGGFTADLVLSDAELARLALSDKATDEDRKKIGTGRVTASLSLQQTFGPNADRTGRGDLIVRDGDIYNVPLSMGLMQVATLRLPVARSFQQASMSYFLRNDEITFERVLLESQGINLAGLGTVSLASHNIDMTFITESPHEVNIPVITPFLIGVRNELLELSVTGPIDNPRITPVPLSAISNFLRALLPRTSADARHK